MFFPPLLQEATIPVQVSCIVRPIETVPKDLRLPLKFKAIFSIKATFQKNKQLDYNFEEVWVDISKPIMKLWKIPINFSSEYLKSKIGTQIEITPIKVLLTDSKGKRLAIYGSDGSFTKTTVNRPLKRIIYQIDYGFDAEEKIHIDESINTVVE